MTTTLASQQRRINFANGGSMQTALAMDDEISENNHRRKVKKLRMDNQRTRRLSPEEEDRLMVLLNGRRPHLRPIVSVAIYTGMRRGELFKLRRSHVDFRLNLINVKQTKTGKDRTIQWTSPLGRYSLDSVTD